AGGEGTLLPTTSPAADLSTSPDAAAAGLVSADSATDPAAGTKSSDVAAALYFADPAALADSEGRNPANLLDLLDVVGDGSGLVGDVVDGVVEDPQADYERQLVELAAHGVLVDPPLPEALVLVKVPFLGLLGITDEPAELVGPQGGPVPEDVARKLLKNSSSFLRVLTDPITGEALPLEPQRYSLRAAERAVLQGLAGCCYVPNCPHPVLDTELDHLRAFEFGGPSVMANLRPACKRHHLMKHFKDDKDRHGRRRCIDEPERHGIKLRGWTPQATPDGRIGWITPSGTYRPPLNTEPARPDYPKWLKNLITKTTKKPAS
ncbi:HNH endonuclease signature motif containing protein, partial [Arthrobacter sp. BF1]|uniref:HNH endonuclease signature motif containing protein n=1 Tax=Arthrobacter sp. BF1 TaxID=2821145 RepID=UPI001C4EB618